MEAVVLAAGEGQRLRPFTATKPKVMIEVGNKPILQYVIEALKGAGIRKILLVVGYKRERVIDYFGNGERFGVDIDYVIQKQQLGTAHALKQAEEFVRDRFLVVPGDNIVDTSTIECALDENYAIVYRKLEEVSKYGVLVIKNGRVTSIIEKPEEKVSYLVNTGLYLLDKTVFDFIETETDLTDVINKMIEEGLEFIAVETRGEWLDIVYPWDIVRVNDLALRYRGKMISGKVEKNVSISGDIVIGEGTVIRSGTYIIGPAVIGENCEIGPNTVIEGPTSIGSGTKIEASSIVLNSVIGNSVIVGSGSHIEGSVIDSGVKIHPRFTAVSGKAGVRIGDEFHEVETGVFIGEGCKIGAGVISEAGTIIGNNSNISALKILRGVIPEGSRVL